MSRFLYSSLMMAPVLVATTISQADLVNRWSVGDGDSSAMIQFDFIEGETYVFDISFDEGSFTGQDALDLLVAETDGPFEFTYDVISYSFGDFLTGVGIDTSYNYGDGTEAPDYNYWAYWTQESGSDWVSSMIGFGDRLLADGAADGWVFGTDAMPSTIPAPPAVALVAAGLMLQRRRCRRVTSMND